MPQLRKNGCGVINYRGLRQRYSVKSRDAIGYSNFTPEIPLRRHGTRVTSLKRRDMKVFCMDASTNSKHHGELWNQKMKPLLPNKGKKQSKIILLENKSLVTDTLTVANNYFSEVAVTEEMDKIADDLQITQASNLSLRNAIINCASVLIP